MAEKPGLDPRYNPAFQRGFEASAAPDASRTSSSAGVAQPPPRVASALQTPLGPPPGASTASERAAAAVPATASVAATADGAPAATVVVKSPQLRAPWGNPFVVALALVGFGAIAFGVWLLQQAAREADGGGLLVSQSGYLMLQAMIMGAPLAFGVGVLILSAVLVLFAVHWSRLPHHADADAGAS